MLVISGAQNKVLPQHKINKNSGVHFQRWDAIPVSGQNGAIHNGDCAGLWYSEIKMGMCEDCSKTGWQLRDAAHP